MIKVVLCGYGQMGKLLHAAISKRCDMETVMIVDSTNVKELYLRCPEVDLIIDFSHPYMLSLMQDYVKTSGCALLSGTTGYDGDQLHVLKQLSHQTRVMYSANYSLGIAVLLQAVKNITPILKNTFDMEIVELHHRHKQDAPSGTALSIKEAMDPHHQYSSVYGRYALNESREKEIGIHAVRGGNAAGEHHVLYLGDDETLELKHTANSRNIFVQGALTCAKWLMKQPNGYYTMEQMIKGE